MTDTTNTVENNEPAQTTGAQPQPPRGVIEHLHPATLRLGENVRDSIDLGKEFLASVREHGVLVPITAVRGDDGVITVRNGQRRTVAAREIGLPTVPVYVLAATTTDTAAETIDRIAHQIVTNDQKRDLSEAQRARGMQQMIAAGLSAAKVARKLSVTRVTVNAAEAVGRSPAAMDALAGGQLSLAEAVTLSEFDGDDEAIDELVDVAGTDRFAHDAARLRKDRERKQAALAAAQPYAERGFTVLLEFPSWRSIEHIALDRLWTPDGREAGEQHVTNPAHWAIVPYEEEVYLDAQGDIVDGDNIDWSTRGRPEATPEDGHLHADAVTEETRWVIDYYCTDPAAAGLTLHGPGHRPGDATPSDAELDPSERDAREAAELDKKRAERRKLIALNKLGDAAGSVRVAWLRDHLVSRRTPPKGGQDPPPKTNRHSRR